MFLSYIIHLNVIKNTMINIMKQIRRSVTYHKTVQITARVQVHGVLASSSKYRKKKNHY